MQVTHPCPYSRPTTSVYTTHVYMSIRKDLSCRKFWPCECRMYISRLTHIQTSDLHTNTHKHTHTYTCTKVGCICMMRIFHTHRSHSNSHSHTLSRTLSHTQPSIGYIYLHQYTSHVLETYPVPIVYTRVAEWLRPRAFADRGLLPHGFESICISMQNLSRHATRTNESRHTHE